MAVGCVDCDNRILDELRDLGIDAELLEPVLEKYGNVEGSLITVLQMAQEIYGYLPMALLGYIGRRMGIPAAKVLGVVSFYAQFRRKPVGKNLILLCQGTACHVNGSGAIEQIIADDIGCGEGDISTDGVFTYNNVACLGCCSLAPAMMIGDKTYGNLNRQKVLAILAEIRQMEEGA